MHEVAYAKINLALHVRGRMMDGYHRLETLFAFAEDGDRLWAEEAEDLELETSGPFAASLGEATDNLVLRAAKALRERAGIRSGARLRLWKALPVASGIGGGSADAAAALRLLSHHWEIEEADLAGIAASLGADIPACLGSRPAIGRGRGDRLDPVDLPGLRGTPILLVNPGIALSTARVFAAWDGKDRGPLGDWRHGRNDLEPAAIAQVPEIKQVLASMPRAHFVRMSGSGATCFGLYAGEAAHNADLEEIRAAHPEWWLLPTRLR